MKISYGYHYKIHSGLFYLAGIPGGGSILTVYLGVLIGTSFLFDLFFRIIPNKLLLTGYFFLLPIVYSTHGIAGVWQAVAGVGMSFILLWVVYLIKGMGAGDVKLICLVCGYIGVDRTLEYLVLTFFAGAIFGVLKYTISRMEEGRGPRELTRIKFTIPILTAYMFMLLTVGGAL